VKGVGQKKRSIANVWKRLGPRALPFADAATPELPLGRLLRLSLFQVSVGMVLVLLNGTINRVMIVELGIPAWMVALLVALPIVFAPLRALIGHRSDHHRSLFGWRRVPYIWFGTLGQFGGLALMPFALLVLSGTGTNPMPFVGEIGAGVAFLLVGAGLHTTQTAGVALATDLATPESRPRVVALLYVMLLVGMVVASLVFGALLRDFGYVKLIQIIQGAAVVTAVLNLIALWKQEGKLYRDEDGEPVPAPAPAPRRPFRESLRELLQGGAATRLLVAVGLGGAGFSMQDILLEPYGGELLNLSVSATTVLTAMMAGGTLAGLFVAARWLSNDGDPHRLAAFGALIGIAGFSAVIFAAPLTSVGMFWFGTVVIGFGGGWFSVGTLAASMSLSERGQSGLAIGAWGAVQATASGLGIAIGGAVRDGVSTLAIQGALGPGLIESQVGYSFVYHLEIALLFGTLVAIGPLVRSGVPRASSSTRFGLAEMPS
jgi:BCD family chlorophyll transporter-like MFS transporter